jgi:plasmid maintenance system antidote protein VapI
LEGSAVSDKRNFAGSLHLSEVINEELHERGWTLRDLVFRMRRYESEKDWGIEMLAMEMFMVVHEKTVTLDQKTADGLGTAFDISPQFFINFHEAWRAKQP